MWDIIKAAGWPIVPLIFVSIVALALIIERHNGPTRRLDDVPHSALSRSMKLVGSVTRRGLTRTFASCRDGFGFRRQLFAGVLISPGLNVRNA